MNELNIIKMLSTFPIGDEVVNQEELLSKAEIVSFLSRYQEQFFAIDIIDERENIVKKFLADILLLESEEIIPDLSTAERILKLSHGFIQDFGKVQLIKENNPAFNQTFDLIADNIDLTKNNSRTM